MIALVSWFAQFLHPGRSSPGGGYWFWSGVGSDFSEAAILVAVATWLRGRNCHVRRCWRLSWHLHPEHGHPVCRRHHPHGRGLVAARPSRCEECGVRRGAAHHPTCSRSKKNRRGA